MRQGPLLGPPSLGERPSMTPLCGEGGEQAAQGGSFSSGPRWPSECPRQGVSASAEPALRGVPGGGTRGGALGPRGPAGGGNAEGRSPQERGGGV